MISLPGPPPPSAPSPRRSSRLVRAIGMILMAVSAPLGLLAAIAITVVIASVAATLFIEAFASFELPSRNDAMARGLAAVENHRYRPCRPAKNAVIHPIVTRPFDSGDGGLFDTGPYPQDETASQVHEVVIDADSPCGPVRFRYIVYESIVILGFPIPQPGSLRCLDCKVQRRP